MLDTHFPRPLGDIGNEETFLRHGIPVRYRVIKGASPQRIVKEADPTLVHPFVKAAIELAEEGAAMITTSCGFLASYQTILSSSVAVPVITSSLLTCKHFLNPGIVTFDAASLTSKILSAAAVPVSTPIQGVEPGCEFHKRILNDENQLDLVEANSNVIDAALRLVLQAPAVEDIVLECTNMPPYRLAVADATGRRVHDIETFVVEQWHQRQVELNRSNNSAC